MTRHRIGMLSRQHTIRGAQEQRHPRIDQIDPREPDRYVPGKHHALGQDVVHDVEQGRVVGAENPLDVRRPLRSHGELAHRAHWRMKL